ncbi:MAG: hypothetical protein IPI20_19250 [Rhodoferax sp.]|nr:hypothetical protein [Rhodoferax sp.]
MSFLNRLIPAVAGSLMLAATLALPATASTLGDAAAQMQPGDWRVLNQAGDGAGFEFSLLVSCAADCGDNILNYTDKGMWNPLTREIQFIGKGHLRELKHISYSEANNRWSQEAQPNWDCGRAVPCWSIGHGYEHSTINPANGDIYQRLFNSPEVYKWTRATKTWSRLPVAPNLEVAIALQYFPEMGGLVMVGGGQVAFYRESTGTWSSLATGLAMGGYHTVASYSPIHKIVVLGGGNGSTSLYRLSANGTVSSIANAPIGVGISQSIFTVDPVSGKFLLFGSSREFFEYNPTTNGWSSVASSSVPMFRGGSNAILYRAAVPISTHGVIAFLAEGGSADSRVFLYRHTTGPSAPPMDTTPPIVPTGLVVN